MAYACRLGGVIGVGALASGGEEGLPGCEAEEDREEDR